MNTQSDLGARVPSGLVVVPSVRLDRILIAIDFSQDSHRALALVAALAKPRAELTLFHVCDPVRSMETIVPGVDVDIDELADRSTALLVLEKLRIDLHRAGFPRIHARSRRVIRRAGCSLEQPKGPSTSS